MRPLPDCRQAIVMYRIEDLAAERPGAVAVIDHDGTRWTWSQARDQMYAAANALQGLGVKPGDRVGIMLPNGRDWLRAWWGVSLLGAVMVAINPAYRGDLLAHVVSDSGLSWLVAGPELRDRIGEIPGPVEVIHPPVLDMGDFRPPAERPALQLWDTAAIGYTSGTTGPSKGVVQTYAQMWRTAPVTEWSMSGDDVMLVTTAMFHTGGWGPAMAAWLAGGGVALCRQFRVDRFLDDIRETGATITLLLGVMASVLAAQPRTEADARHSLRRAVIVPMAPDPSAFMKRFGIDTAYVMYGMSEVPQCLEWAWQKVDKPATAGKPRDGFEIRLVNEYDEDVAPGETGELVIRADMPWVIATEYLNRPDASARAWRNGWFHTGDQFRVDEEGFYYFVDRATDSLRRRGENVSSFEVEREVLAHPAVAEAACLGVPAEHGEHDVYVGVVPAPGHDIDPAELIEFLRPRMAYFMIPRYIEVLSEFPRTPSSKVAKYLLRQRGLPGTAWDRDAAGIRVKRDY